MDSREEIGDLLTLEGKIDLAIPRGGQELVKAAMEMASGRVPVLGHTEGVCHVFIDKHVDLEKALRISKHLQKYNFFTSKHSIFSPEAY